MGGYHGQSGSNRKLLATGLAAIFLVVLGFVFSELGKRKSAADALFAERSRSILSGDYAAMRDAVKGLGQQVAEDDRAPSAVLALDARAEVALSLLYTGSVRQRERAGRLLDLAKSRATPADLEVKITEAFVEGSIGDPAVAADLLGDATLRARYPKWSRISQAESDLRRGVAVDPRELASAGIGGLPGVWAIRIAWAQGDAELVRNLATQVLADNPSNPYAETLLLLSSARIERDGAALASLRDLLESGVQLPAVLGSLVVVDLTRMLRREGQEEEAAQLLLSLAEQDPESQALQAEIARTERFKSHFGVAFDQADKALRASPADPGLLAEMAAALFFRDAAEKIESRLRPIPEDQHKTDGVRRARAIATLLKGNPAGAIEDLSSTRHLGPPGDGELWLSEAFLRSGQADEALAEARRARSFLARVYGEPSHETTIAALYEGLALQAQGQKKAAARLVRASYVRPYQTPWAAWLYGRYLASEGKTRAAKDLFLLACHHGQDFALSCYDLSQIYQSMRLDEVERSIQRKARELYLRTAPEGVHAVEVREALGRTE